MFFSVQYFRGITVLIRSVISTRIIVDDWWRIPVKGGRSMRCTKKMMLIFWMTVFATVIFLPMQVSAAEDNSCYIQAPSEMDLWVIIFEEDNDGNRSEKILWKGKLKAGEKKLLQTRWGMIRYEYATDPNQPYSGDVTAVCHDKQTVMIN
jgi:hypothetical protein